MIFIPKYTVSYKGILRASGKPFEIDDVDTEEMSRHGCIVATEKGQENELKKEQSEKQRKPGRPKKTETKEVSFNECVGSPKKKNP